MAMKIYIPPVMPSYIPKLNIGMPPLPFTDTGPFQQLKIKPEGGKINATTSLSRIGNGGVKLATKQKRTNRNRKVYSAVSKSTGKTKVRKAKKVQTNPGINGKLLNGNGNGKKKARTFQKTVKRGLKKVSKYILRRGGRSLSRDSNGRFIKGGK